MTDTVIDPWQALHEEWERLVDLQAVASAFAAAVWDEHVTANGRDLDLGAMMRSLARQIGDSRDRVSDIQNAVKQLPRTRTRRSKATKPSLRMVVDNARGET